MSQFVLALDQGTTSSRAIVFGRTAGTSRQAQQEFPQILPCAGARRTRPEAIWSIAIGDRSAMPSRDRDRARRGGHRRYQSARDDDPLGPHDRQAGRQCHRLAEPRHRAALRATEARRVTSRPFATRRGWSSIRISPAQRSGTCSDTAPVCESRGARRGPVRHGRLVSHLAADRRPACMSTDYSNASRTLLFNIHTLDWDDELLKILGVPRAMLPEVRPSSHVTANGTDAVRRRHSRSPATPAISRRRLFGQACFAGGEKHIRHRLLRAAQYRHHTRADAE